MLSIAHIINPVDIGSQSDLFIAQPITFETMRRAKAYAEGQVEVELYTTQYPEDHDILPDGFTILPDMTRSALDIAQFNVPRKLPLLKDILDRMYEASDADYFIYTNVDIALMPNFYVSVAKMLEEHDALVINRRTISNQYSQPDEIPLMYALAGNQHQGWDCFVFRRELYPQIEFGTSFIGIIHIGLLFYANLLALADSFCEHKDMHLTFHIGDDRVWSGDKFNDYTEHNMDQMVASLLKLREKIGTLDSSTAVGKFIYHKHIIEHRYRLREALLLDYDDDELEKLYWKYRNRQKRNRFQKQIRRQIRQLIKRLTNSG